MTHLDLVPVSALEWCDQVVYPIQDSSLNVAVVTPTGTKVDVKREFMPCGQGVGAINELVPAGDIVRSMVAEAERTLERIAAVKR